MTEILLHTFESLMCPITCTVFKDPVITIADGHTYERDAIIAWLRDHNTSPRTGIVLSTKEIVTNFCVKSLIEEMNKLPSKFEALKARNNNTTPASSDILHGLSMHDWLRNLGVSQDQVSNVSKSLASIGGVEYLSSMVNCSYSEIRNALINCQPPLNSSAIDLMANGVQYLAYFGEISDEPTNIYHPKSSGDDFGRMNHSPEKGEQYYRLEDAINRLEMISNQLCVKMNHQESGTIHNSFPEASYSQPYGHPNGNQKASNQSLPYPQGVPRKLPRKATQKSNSQSANIQPSVVTYSSFNPFSDDSDNNEGANPAMQAVSNKKQPMQSPPRAGFDPFEPISHDFFASISSPIGNPSVNNNQSQSIFATEEYLLPPPFPFMNDSSSANPSRNRVSGKSNPGNNNSIPHFVPPPTPPPAPVPAASLAAPTNNSNNRTTASTNSNAATSLLQLLRPPPPPVPANASTNNANAVPMRPMNSNQANRTAMQSVEPRQPQTTLQSLYEETFRL